MTNKFRKRPVEIEAVHYNGQNILEILRWVGTAVEGAVPGGFIQIKTLEGTMKAIPGDWIIKGIQGEFYPCKPDIFAETYEAVDD